MFEKLFRGLIFNSLPLSPPYLTEWLNSSLDPTLGDQCIGAYEISIYMKNNARKFYIGVMKRKFVVHLKKHKRDILQYQPATTLSRFYFNNPDSHTDFENARITIPFNSIIEGVQKESIQIIRGNYACNGNISRATPRHWISILE